MSPKKELSNKQFNFFIVLFFIAGVYVCLEPNIRGVHGYHEVNTLGRIGGLTMILLGWQGIRKIFVFADKIRLSSYIIFSSIVIISSGLVSFTTGYSYGIEHIDKIRDPLFRLFELVYAVIGIVLIYYRRKICEIFS